MSAQVTFVRVHEREQVEEIVEQATQIADSTGFEGQNWRTVFEKSVDLLAARLPLTAMPAPMPFDLGNLKLRQ